MTGYPDAIDDRRYTVEQYLAMETESPTKHDYVDGRILDMAGGTVNHSTIAVNLVGEFRQALKGSGCRVYGSDQRLQDYRKTLYTYPDAQIVCGEPEHAAHDKSRTTITNPKVLFEVTSVSTEAYDRGDKLKRYVALPTLRDFILVSQTSPRIETYHCRDDGTWLFSWIEGLNQTLHVASVDVSVPLTEIYRDVTFPPPEPDESVAD